MCSIVIATFSFLNDIFTILAKHFKNFRKYAYFLSIPLMDQLKALHDEYTEKYENTHQKDWEAIWKEYIEKNKELLK